MQLVTFFCVLVAVASEPIVKTWTLHDLSTALETKTAGPLLQPHLRDALNKIMLDLYTGTNTNGVYAAIPSPQGSSTWTLAELNKAITDPSTASWKSVALKQARHIFTIGTEKPRETVPVLVPALDVSLWTQDDVSQAIENSNINPALIPYLERASNQFKKAIASGEKLEIVGMVTSVGIITMKEGKSEFIPAPKIPELSA